VENKAIVLDEWEGETLPIWGEDCPLCDKYCHPEEDKCGNCPLKERGTACCKEWLSCSNSVFSQEAWETACQALIDKLESLL